MNPERRRTASKGLHTKRAPIAHGRLRCLHENLLLPSSELTAACVYARVHLPNTMIFLVLHMRVPFLWLPHKRECCLLLEAERKPAVAMDAHSVQRWGNRQCVAPANRRPTQTLYRHLPREFASQL